METQDAFLKRFKVGDCYRSSMKSPYYRITRIEEDKIWYMAYWKDTNPYEFLLPKKINPTKNSFVDRLRKGTLSKVKPEELLTKILTGEIKS